MDVKNNFRIVGNKNFCSEPLKNKTVGNNNYCSETVGNEIVKNKTVGNKKFCSNIERNENVRNKNFCSLRLEKSWQTKWARSLSSIIRGFKIGVTKWYRGNELNNNNDYYAQFSWQKSFYDHIIHNEKSLFKIREYIINNPLKWEFDRNNSENLWM